MRKGMMGPQAGQEVYIYWASTMCDILGSNTKKHKITILKGHEIETSNKIQRSQQNKYWLCNWCQNSQVPVP